VNLNGQASNQSVLAFYLQDLDGGGAERSIVALAGEVARRGHRVDLVVGDAHSDYRAEIDPQVRLIDFGTRSALSVFRHLWTYLRDHQPTAAMSALDLPNIMLVIAAKLAGFRGRVVISQRAVVNASLQDLPPIRRCVTQWLQRAFFPRADAVISNSQAAADDLQSMFAIAPPKIHTIHNALNVDRIRRLAREPIDHPFFFKDQTPLIVSVGSLTQRKDMGTLIRAFKHVTDRQAARLVIIGKGPEQDKMEALIANLGLSEIVYLAGFDANPYKWIAAAAVFASASTGEGFPNVIAEALALNCPVVATDCPGDTAELLGHGRWGRLVPVGDPTQMAHAIVDTLNDTAIPNGRIRAADFAPSKITSAYLNVLLPKVGGAASILHESA